LLLKDGRKGAESQSLPGLPLNAGLPNVYYLYVGPAQ